MFIMSKDILTKIKENFQDEYMEMTKLGIRRHKKHQIIIANHVN